MPAKATSLITALQQRGASSSADLQSALRASQPTISRLLSGLPSQVLKLGKGRASLYGLAHPIGPFSAQQTLWRLDAQGQAHAIGRLSFLARSQIHIAAEGVNVSFEPSAREELPWFLAPLRAQGFLGRLQAARLAALGVASNPERWDTHSTLLAALHTQDAPGSLLLGDATLADAQALPALPATDPGDALDALAADLARLLPAGSSAGGEQPKFLAVAASGQPLLVKFSAPLGTPFGDRWSDLLHAESLASSVLQRHGQAAADCQTITTKERTYLLSTRFDRLGPQGRVHTVALGAVHAAFVPGPWVNWSSTCDALAHQGRLPAQDAERAAFLLQFGQLIGNTDMHSGNASVFALGDTLADMLRGQFKLAPCYDMLPMRFKPDPMVGLVDYAPFAPDTRLASPGAKQAALEFWNCLAQLPAVSQRMRALAQAQQNDASVGQPLRQLS